MGNLSEFLAMGGYGFYVWGSYAVTLVAMAGELFLLSRRRKKAAEQVRGILVAARGGARS